MTIHFKTPCFLLLGAAAILSGCATTQPTAYQGLDSSEYLRPNEQSRRGHEPYVYNTPVDWKRYSTFIIEPVKIYRGPDNQFEKVSEEGKQELASYMHEQFDEKLRQKYTPVSSPQQDTLRIKMTLTGAKPTKQFIGTVMKMDLAGGPYNATQAVRGREGAFSGSVSYAVEIYDAATNRLLKAYVDKQYPNAMNMKSTFGSLTASKTGIRKGADNLLENLQ
jgi:hypothetical protein